MTRDPVCGMEVNPKKTKFKKTKDDKTYYFCSKNCLDKWARGSSGRAEENIASSFQPPDSSKNTERLTLKISGMHCAGCALTIEKNIKKLDGVTESSANFATESAY